MDGLYFEQRTPNGSSALAWDIARHLYTRQLWGKVAIVAEHPTVLASCLGKQWQRVLRQARRERSSTLTVTRLAQLSRDIANVQVMRFSTNPDNPEATVLILTPDALLSFPPIFHTLYVTYQVDCNQLGRLARVVRRGGLVVAYTPEVRGSHDKPL